MFVYHFKPELFRNLPTFYIIGAPVKWPDSSNHNNFRVFFFDGFVNHCETLFKNIGYQVFVADANVFQVKRFRMPGFSADSPPLRVYVSICPFNQVEHILHIFIHVAHRNSSLLAVASIARILARHAGSQHRNRFSSNIFTKLKILEIAQSHTLVIIPDVALWFPSFERPDCVFPPVNVMNPVAVSHTTSRKPYKPRMDICNCLCQILS